MNRVWKKALLLSTFLLVLTPGFALGAEEALAVAQAPQLSLGSFEEIVIRIRPIIMMGLVAMVLFAIIRYAFARSTTIGEEVPVHRTIFGVVLNGILLIVVTYFALYHIIDIINIVLRFCWELFSPLFA